MQPQNDASQHAAPQPDIEQHAAPLQFQDIDWEALFRTRVCVQGHSHLKSGKTKQGEGAQTQGTQGEASQTEGAPGEAAQAKASTTRAGMRRKFEPGSPESRAQWDAKAASFAHKPRRSDYIAQLKGHLNLQPGETVFDMGCGSGTLAVPLAQEGHRVVAVDFSPRMLEELHCAAENAGVLDMIETHQRSWQEPFDDFPVCDVAVSSRSFITNDLVDGLTKLESKARRRVFLSTGAGDIPYRDRRIHEAMGRTDAQLLAPVELSCILNWLLINGRYPTLEYITFPGQWHRGERDELVASIRETHAPQTPEESRLLDEFLAEHLVQGEDGNWGMDYMREDRWAVISWEPPAK